MEEQKKQKISGGKIAAAVLAGIVQLALLVGIIVFVYSIGDQSIDDNYVGINNTVNGRVISQETEAKIHYIQQIIDQMYLFDSDVDYDTAVIKGYVDALGDPYTVYYTPEEYDDMMQSSSGEYCGIGVVVTQDVTTGVVKVVKPYVGCPGDEAGIKADDYIYEVAGEEVTGMDLNLVVSKIKGDEGTFVNITVYRPSTNEYIEMEVERRQIEIESVTYEMLEDQIGYIAMDSFTEVTYDQFMKAFNALSGMGMEGLIVDLRDNGGGLLTSVVDILDELLPEGMITYTEEKSGHSDQYKSDANCILDVPCAVLVNGNSASASEIFTGAMQDHEAGVIVGTQTFGKGIVQIVLPFSDGSAMKITMARYFTPNGVCIHGEGITPNIVIEQDYETEEDEQLEEAVKAVKDQMK